MDRQTLLFPMTDGCPRVSDKTSSTFADNIKLPVHRWFRFSAGFSAQWAECAIREHSQEQRATVLDPFAGSGTTLLAAENCSAPSYGVEAHPFLYRVAAAKLCRRTSAGDYSRLVARVLSSAKRGTPKDVEAYPALVHKCFSEDTLARLDVLRHAVEDLYDGSPASELVWLTLVSILRKTSHVNTAQWQYVLPNKSKSNPLEPFYAFEQAAHQFHEDMVLSEGINGPNATLILGDARTCESLSDDSIDLVVCSPPYPNNYDYADATRLEMSFMREISGWGDLQEAIRKYLVRSCSQHVPEKAINLDEVLAREEVEPIRNELTDVCQELAKVRLTKGGKKTYHLMVACYFVDLAQVWKALRRVSRSPARACFVVGDSAPYGVYVPVIHWLGKLAIAAGFKSFCFERTRERNVKWKNRKHRVPLCEGRLWVEG